MSPPVFRRHWFGASQAVMFIAGICFFAASVILLGVLPGLRLERAIRNDAPVTLSAYTQAQLHGRSLYATQGCAYCHSQQVSNTVEDVRRWGPPTEAWETRYDAPQLWGTRRIGPDLARETGVRSKDWQLAHLYDPRLVVPGSVMPGYPWLFEHSAARPTRDALDLVAYLDTLGAARREAGCKARLPSTVGGTMPVMSDEVAIASASLDADPSRTQPVRPGSVDASSQMRVLPAGDAMRGSVLFGQSCAGCHGARGDGRSAAAAALRPGPADLTQFAYSDAALHTILENGVSGSSMPAWRDLSDQQMADLIAWLHTIGPSIDRSAVAPAALALGAQLYANDCAVCHGVNGRGDGPMAALIRPMPYDFLHVRPSTQAVDRALREGIPGSAMPSFPNFTTADREALANFVGSLYRDGAAGSPAAPAAPH
ncbi:MAG: cbb3-type cytochrome c oxidase subunit II [Paraburkholderia fungorum]|nr:cbb3-type cytochrome c oxidase subunit II [Paraburkholderia fungorum]